MIDVGCVPSRFTRCVSCTVLFSRGGFTGRVRILRL